MLPKSAAAWAVRPALARADSAVFSITVLAVMPSRCARASIPTHCSQRARCQTPMQRPRLPRPASSPSKGAVWCVG